MPPKSFADRAVTVYASSEAELQSWFQKAASQGLSFANWVRQTLSDSNKEGLQLPAEWYEEANEASLDIVDWLNEMVLKAKHPVSDNYAKLSQDADTLQAEILKLQESISTKDLLLEKQKTELLKLKQARFLEDGKREGRYEFDYQMIKLLSFGGVWNTDRLCEALHIDIRDPGAMKIVNRQLQELRWFGVVEETARGWRWTKKMR
jgi:hypothetical protein